MKIKSVSGLTCFVRDLEKTAAFYEALGFEIRKREANHLTAYSNWFWIDFVAIGKDERTKAADVAPGKKGSDLLVYLSVDNVDDSYATVLSAGLQPVSEPKNQPWGNREFLLRDPDGHNLVIFKRK